MAVEGQVDENEPIGGSTSGNRVWFAPWTDRVGCGEQKRVAHEGNPHVLNKRKDLLDAGSGLNIRPPIR